MSKDKVGVGDSSLPKVEEKISRVERIERSGQVMDVTVEETKATPVDSEEVMVNSLVAFIGPIYPHLPKHVILSISRNSFNHFKVKKWLVK